MVKTHCNIYRTISHVLQVMDAIPPAFADCFGPMLEDIRRNCGTSSLRTPDSRHAVGSGGIHDIPFREEYTFEAFNVVLIFHFLT